MDEYASSSVQLIDAQYNARLCIDDWQTIHQ